MPAPGINYTLSAVQAPQAVTLRPDPTDRSISHAELTEPIGPRILRNVSNEVRVILGLKRVPAALWVKGKPIHLAEEVAFSLDLARRRWEQTGDIDQAVESLRESEKFLRSFWGSHWHERVAW